MARPLRFRRSDQRWTEGRVRSELLGSLDANLGARMTGPWYTPPAGYEAVRFEMDNGDIALFAWDDERAFWLGNTETPSALWQTEKYGFDAVPSGVATWAEKELLAQLHEEATWLSAYPAVSWFFLPVLLSKDGRETSRRFLRDHAAGFPDADPDEGLGFYEAFLASGALDDWRYTMASKLGTSERLDHTRMAATMAEFNVAWLLVEAGYAVTPEIDVTTGHAIDFRAERDGTASLVEVTRPLPPGKRSAGTPIAAVRETAATKTGGQLSAHGGGVTLFVDCSSFPDDDWATVLAEQPDVGHRPAVVFRIRPDGRIEGYAKGAVPLELSFLRDG